MSEPLLHDLDAAIAAAERYPQAVRAGLSTNLSRAGRLDPALLEREQFAAHGYAWVATTVAALRALGGWARWLSEAGAFGEIERLIAGAAFGEYLSQLLGGIAMSQGEVVRPADLGAAEAAARLGRDPAVRALIAQGNSPQARSALAIAAAEGGFGAQGLG